MQEPDWPDEVDDEEMNAFLDQHEQFEKHETSRFSQGTLQRCAKDLSAHFVSDTSSAETPCTQEEGEDEPVEQSVDDLFFRDRDRVSMQSSGRGDSISFEDPGTGEQLFLRYRSKDKENVILEKILHLQRQRTDLGSLYIEGLLSKISTQHSDEQIFIQPEIIPTDPWTTVYAPKAFKHLLSDTKTNRQLLKWLKSWDPITFPKNTLSKTQRPHPVLLIAGPPGTGKTTLAHIAAQHCGYRVLEINASDERSGKQIRKALTDGTQMKSVFVGQKPNCVVLDEIDGAVGGEGQSAVGELVKMAKVEGAIKRPVICIANHLYAKSLKTLRMSDAIVLECPLPDPKVIIDFLYTVAMEQDIRTDKSTLSLLFEHCGGDIRLCLNTLQFISYQIDGKLSKQDIQSLPFGAKDKDKSMFDTWESIFSPPSTSSTTNSTYFETFTHQFSLSDASIIREGIFENYLTRKYADPTLEKTLALIEWLETTSLFEADIQENQKYQLSPYLSMAPAAVHFMGTSKYSAAVRFPRPYFDNQSKASKRKSVLDDFRAQSPVSVNLGLTNPTLIVEFIPFVYDILTSSSRVKSKAFRNASASDREFIASIRLLLERFGVALKAEVFSFYPDVFELIQFKGVPARSTLSLEFRKMLYEEIHRPAIKYVAAAPIRTPTKDKTIFGASKRKKRRRNDHLIRYKFNEGVTNAIRRPVLMKDLLFHSP